MEYLQYSRIGKNWDFSSTTVLNLVINGIPSILTYAKYAACVVVIVLNLVINGIPSIHTQARKELEKDIRVLNLVINGIPSIPRLEKIEFDLEF